MKYFLLIGACLLSACSSTTHSFMDNAYIGTIRNHSIVLFKDSTANGHDDYYRPQFRSNCLPEFNINFDENSTACLIRDDRIVNLKKYKD